MMASIVAIEIMSFVSPIRRYFILKAPEVPRESSCQDRVQLKSSGSKLSFALPQWETSSFTSL